jgi:hypothetical protein
MTRPESFQCYACKGKFPLQEYCLIAPSRLEPNAPQYAMLCKQCYDKHQAEERAQFAIYETEDKP